MGERINALMELDARSSSWFRLQEKGGFWRPAVILAHSGDSWLWMGALTLIWLLGDRDWHRLAALMALAVGAQALVIFAVKQLVRRERPQGQWGSIYRTIDPHSFPSGHATRAALLAVMAAGLGPPWFAIILLVWAPLVALARVATGVHYVSDVIAGALIGIVMGAGMLAVQAHLPPLLPFLF
jgi:undecaprenyl-diphosphatase